MNDQKTAVITGASKGIGRAIALRLAAENYNLVLNYRSEEPLELIHILEEKGVCAIAVKGDVSLFNEAKQICEATKEKFGKLDILINNAGITKDALIMRMDESDFDEVVATNLKGSFNMIKHASKIMTKQRSGKIINMTSVIGLSGNIGQSNYAAAKAGIIGLTKSIAKELAPFGILCNAIAPGFVQTDMTAKLNETLISQIKDRIPLKRFCNPDEIAELAAFLCSTEYITGQVICMDGGMCI